MTLYSPFLFVLPAAQEAASVTRRMGRGHRAMTEIQIARFR